MLPQNYSKKTASKNVLKLPTEIHKWRYSLERKIPDPLLRLCKISVELPNIFIFHKLEDL